ncbi:metalloregulator ArsR/SmtB family transcription factor [Ruminococcaceae bacterium OttesenSCG-928-I18]|nr:metalloregulator ArsR/SmtB family transcription factor [Ruminococcaceae bacterium OttesenSCG-928-I18]
MEERAKQIAELLKVLANENRLMVFCALMERPMNVGEIAKYVPNITLSALSQHLTLLKAHGLLDYQKTGQTITYSIADHRVEEIINVLKKNYCD